jgi:hypothetical protein
MPDGISEVHVIGILITQGHYLKELKKYKLSESKYNASIKLLRTSYGAWKGKIELYLLLKKKVSEFQDTIDSFFELEPTNPTVCQDLLNLFDKYKRRKDVIALFKRKIKHYKTCWKRKEISAITSVSILLGMEKR